MVVILIQLIYAGMYVVSKAALNEGLSSFVFVFYRQAAATIFLLPLAIIFERKRAPRMTFPLLVKVFMSAFLGITLSLDVYNVGLTYTSATVGSASTNSVPVITFFLAVLFRMETIKLQILSGKAKVLGVVLCLAGIGMISFYQGPHLNSLNHHHPFNHGGGYMAHKSSHSKTTWIKGIFLMISSNTTWSLWIVLQGFLLKEYPSKLLLTTLQCLFSAIQSFFVAMAFERSISRWRLGLNIGMFAIAYCGFVVTGVSFYLQAWCIEKRGPVFLAMSTPLSLIFTIICSSFFLGEQTTLGSVLGGALMVGGLYSVLWAKSKENIIYEPSIEYGKEFVEEKETTSPFHPL